MAHSKWSCQHCVLLKTVREWSCSVLGLLCMPWSSGAVEQWQGPPALCGPDSSLIAGSSPTLPQLCFPPQHTHTDTHTHTQTHTHTNTHTRKHTHTYANTHTDTHRHTQTHTQTQT